jgi:hypothetical protein
MFLILCDPAHPRGAELREILLWNAVCRIGGVESAPSKRVQAIKKETAGFELVLSLS